jgi:hypothetical protein
MQSSRIIIAGITEGKNFPKRTDPNKPWIDLSNCRNLVIIDKEYFKKNMKYIETLL